MRSKLLLFFAILLAGCTAKADQELPNTQAKVNPTEITEVDPTQAIDPSPVPEIETPPPTALPNLGPAPELTNEVWLNSDQPLRLADLRGKVVLLEMWTFG
jgi:hypothetical protein